MKRLALVIAVSAFACFQAVGAWAVPNPDNGPGCGLGKLAWADYANQKDIAPQVMMATTNGTFGSNTFGISSGTSGCTNDGKVMSQHQATMFAEVNFENLAQDMAQGQGEHLASLATLLGVPSEYQPTFFAMTQEKYTKLIQSGEASPVAMLAALHEAMAGQPVLAALPVRH
jgi:Protein of unknown function (DUF3015)